MKPTSGQGSARGEAAARQAKKPQKGKKTLPTMQYFKSYKTFQPATSYAAWTGDEGMTIKVAIKPIFEDTVVAQAMAAKYPTTTRINTIFNTESVIDDTEVPVAFANPEIDAHFSSALFLCLSKGLNFFESGAFHVFPNEINPCGKYCLRMYENGNPVRCFFDDKIPTEATESGETKCLLLKHAEPNIMLPTFLHKAFLRFVQFKEFTSLDVVTAFTGFVHFDITLDWANLSFWDGRPDSLVALYIKDEKNEGLGSDRLFHILDHVDLDQHRKFVKLQCPGAKWTGRFSGYEEDTRHWTNQIRNLLEIDPETATTAGYFWMIWDDIVENFDCIMVFSPASAFSSNLRKVDQWVPKESQFYVPPAPILLHATGAGRVQLCCAALPTTAPTNDLTLTLRRFQWSSAEAPLALEVETSKWKTTNLEITKPEETFEIETVSRGGYVLQLLSNDTHLDFENYSNHCTVTAAEGDLPFYVCLDDFSSHVFQQRFELIGKVAFNLDQPGNVSFALFVSNVNQKKNMAALLFNNDQNDIVTSTNLRSGSVALTPNKRGYTLLVYGLYNDQIFQFQPIDLIGKWRLRIFSDVALSDIVDTPYTFYTEVEGDYTELEESHQINRNVLSGGCEAVVVLETSQPLSLTLISTEDDKQLNCVRGVGYCILPQCKLPGDKEPIRLIVRGITSEPVTGFTWKLRIFSTAQVTCKEDTAPADKTAAAIAAWEKKRTAKPAGTKKSEAKTKSSEPQVVLAPPVIDEHVLKINEGEGVIFTEEQIEQLIPAAENTEQHTPEAPSTELGEDLRDQITQLSGKINEEWDQYEQKRIQISKLYTPPPKEEEGK